MVQGARADYDAMDGRASARAPAWSPEELHAMFAFMEEINTDLAASGELVDAQGLSSPADARMVTADRDGRAVVTDDPYGPNEVLMAGYWVLDCASLDRVTEIAARVARCPVPEGSREYPVVIRPIGEPPADPGRMG